MFSVLRSTTIHAVTAPQVTHTLVVLQTPALAGPSSGVVAVGLIVFAAQLALIVGLLLQRIRRRRAEEALRHAEARNSAVLKAIPDLMFVLLRDGTYVDYHAGDAKSLFVPPSVFIGRKIRDIMPAPLADVMMDALDRASRSDEPVVVNYDLPIGGETRFFEARIVQKENGRLLSIVRDVTEWKRASELNRDLARRLIAGQEIERQRIARELHDDVSQRLALVNIEIDEIAAEPDIYPLQDRLYKVSVQVGEIASDVHNLSYELHPSKLQAIGLVGAVQALCRDASKQSNVYVAFSHGTIPPSVNPDVALCLYRIVQEALHNVARHSHARAAQVALACDETCITLQIADSGVGFDPKHVQHAGLGLVGMRERVAALRGQLTIQAVPGGGTRIAVRLPLGAEANSASPFSQSA